MKRILNIGSLNLDYVYALPTFVRAGETLSSSSLELHCGGKGLNQTVAAARAGAKVLHGGAVGGNGAGLLELLNDCGADTQNIKTVDTPTGHAIIQVVPTGENAIVIYGGANRVIARPDIDSMIESMEAGELLLLQNEINDIPYIMQKAHDKGLVIVFNPAPMDEGVKKYPLELCDWLILNRVEAEALVGNTDSLLAQFNKTNVILTLGQKGSLCQTRDEFVFTTAFEVEAVDTTAAGDCFIGYFAAGLAAGTDLKTALQLASAASALAVCKKGAAPSIPTLKEAQAFLAQNLDSSNA